MPTAMRVEGVGHRPEGLVEPEPMIGGLGLGQARVLARGGPVEAAGVDHRAADDGGVAGQVLGRRMHHDVGALLERPAEVGGRRGVVDDQRHADPPRHLGERRDVGDVAAGVGDRFAEDRLGVAVDGLLDGGQVLGVDEARRPAEAADGVAELGDGAAVKPRRGDDVVARTHQREQRHDLRRMAGRGADAADAALERGEPLGERHHRRVGQARVDEAELLEVEQPGGVLDVAEHVGGVLVDRHLPRAGRRVGLGPGVDLQRVEAERRVGHGVPPASRGARGYASRPGAGNGALRVAAGPRPAPKVRRGGER